MSWFETDETSKQTNTVYQSTVDMLAQKRAEIAAKFANMGLKAPGGSTSAVKPARATAPPPISLPAKPAATTSVALPDPAELARRVAEATTKAAMSANPYIVSNRTFTYSHHVVQLTTIFVAASDSRKEEDRLRC